MRRAVSGNDSWRFLLRLSFCSAGASEACMKLRVVYMPTGMHVGNAAILGECGVVAKRVGHQAFSFPPLFRASIKRLRFLDSWALVTLRECSAWSNAAFKAGGTFPMHTAKFDVLIPDASLVAPEVRGW